ncbi:MAG: hypothetical protein ACUVUG_07385, partial [Candidatus Aminicenantia bacterium]
IKPLYIILLIFLTSIYFSACSERVFDNPFDPYYSKGEFFIVNYINLPSSDIRNITWDGSTLIGIAPSGTIYFINKVNGSLIRTMTSPLSGPTGIVYDGTGLWLSSQSSTEIVKINILSGEVIKRTGVQRLQLSSLAWDGESILGYDSLTKRIYKINPETGEVINSFKSPGFTTGGMVFIEGNLWLSDTPSSLIYKINMEGKILSTYSSPGQTPRGLTFDGVYLWNADSSGKAFQLKF